MHPNQPPADPVVRQLVTLAKAGLSRRRFMALGGLGAAGLGLSACAPPSPPTGAAASVTYPKDVSATDKTLKFASWTAYLDYDETTKSHPTLDAFMQASGIKVSYSEDIDDNDTYFNKIAPQLRANQSIDRDIVVFTDWMANRIIQQGLCQPLDLIQMPHATNLLPSLKEISFDPGRRNSLPWQGGFGGICYNRTKLGRDLKSVADLWADDLKGRIVVLSEYRDPVGLIMQANGVDISGPFTKEQVQSAMDEVSAKIASGNIRRVKGNSYLEDLKSGNAVAGIVWSGDIFTLRTETKDDGWQFVLPESGGTIWTDNMMIPITSDHQANAMKLMDYYYEPAVAAQVSQYINYVSPVVGAKVEMEKLDPELAKNPFIFPDEAFLASHKVQSFRALTPAEDADYSAMWEKVVGN